MSKKPTHFASIGSVLTGTLTKLGLDRDLDDYRLWTAWDEVVGEAIARNAQPQKLRGGRLVVVVKSSGWLQELSLLQRDLVKQLNAWMGRPVVKDLYLVVGKVDRIRPRQGTINAALPASTREAGRGSPGNPSQAIPSPSDTATDPTKGPLDRQAAIDQAFGALWNAVRTHNEKKNR